MDTANLAGTIVANIAEPANGLFDDHDLQNVIDAVTRNGAFDTCTINGLPTGSLLLSAGCIYDEQANVDIGVTRAAVQQGRRASTRTGAVGKARVHLRRQPDRRDRGHVRRPVPVQQQGELQHRAEHAVGLGLRELPELVPEPWVFTRTT